MKRLIKRPLGMLWRSTAFLRRPIQRRVEAMLVRCCNPTTHCHISAETSLLMEHLLRELVRLQTQVDALQQAVEDLATSPTGLSVVGGLDADETVTHSAVG